MSPPPPEPPSISPSEALVRLDSCIAAGEALVAQGFLEEGQVHAWQLGVEEVLAAGFGRYSGAYQKAVEAGELSTLVFSGFEAQDYSNFRRDSVVKELAVLKGCRSLLENPLPRAGAAAAPIDALQRITRILDRFHLVVRALRDRRTGREPLTLADEYDVQYLLGALLRVDFEDVREEEQAPSFGGKAPRLDFLLKAEQVVVEAKMTRDTLRSKEVTSQLADDALRYRSHPACKTLVCFVWDPTQLIGNPKALERDLETVPGPPALRVFVRPK